jgi:hypothetical protein
MPVIKLTASCTYYDTVTGKKETLQIPMDITFNGALHYGIASAYFVKQLVQELPSVGPVTQVLKQFLRHYKLSDPYSGGLPAYGMTLIVAAIALQLRQQHRQQRQQHKNLQIKQKTRQRAESRESMRNSYSNGSRNYLDTESLIAKKNVMIAKQSINFSKIQEEQRQQEGKKRQHDKHDQQQQQEEEETGTTFASPPPKSPPPKSPPPKSPLLGPMMSTDDIPSLNGMIPNGLYVTGNTSEAVSVKSTPPSPSPPRRKRFSSVNGNTPFWNPKSQMNYGIQRGMDIGRPHFSTNISNSDVQEEVETLTAVSTTDQALGCLLMDVMHFVSNAFDFERHTLSIMNGGCAYPRQMGLLDAIVIEGSVFLFCGLFVSFLSFIFYLLSINMFIFFIF